MAFGLKMPVKKWKGIVRGYELQKDAHSKNVNKRMAHSCIGKRGAQKGQLRDVLALLFNFYARAD